MTAKQILDSFSQTLIQDERILSPQERQLLISLLQNAKAPGSNSEIQFAVTATIARSVGETVAQRAFTLLGSSIVEQILASASVMTGSHDTMPIFSTNKSPKPPGPPQPDRPAPGKELPVSPKSPKPGVRPDEDLPVPPGPMPPGGERVQEPVQSSVSGHGPVTASNMLGMENQLCVVMDEFLGQQELEELICYTLEHEAEFKNSEVISPNASRGVIDYEYRRSRVLMDVGKHQEKVLKRIQGVLPRVFDRLGIEEFPVVRSEAQITASNDGDFFSAHSDNGHETISSRRITFVYFFHREPCQFAGGELRIHDSIRNVNAGKYHLIVPRQNRIVFFPCSVLHEIIPVECSSRTFADSRFTLNGWLHEE
jgi:Rps23 Pro-64 3,4-dihydroxylase Tpa1-like proline 4-hydroxylase